MDKKLLVLLSATLFLLVFGSCKPKQSAYKSVYEAAKEKEMDVTTQEDQSYNTYEPVSRPNTTPSTTSSNESVRKEKITLVNANDASGLKAYSIVIASFAMKPNAESLKSRMEQAGYKTILVQNEQEMYRVIIASYDSRDQAVARRSEILDDFHSKGSQESLRSAYRIPFNDWWLLQREY